MGRIKRVKLSMKEIRDMRYVVSQGLPIKDVADLFNVSETTVRNYTKAVREGMKKNKEVS